MEPACLSSRSTAVSRRWWQPCLGECSFGRLRGSNSVTTENAPKRNVRTSVRVVWPRSSLGHATALHTHQEATRPCCLATGRTVTCAQAPSPGRVSGQPGLWHSSFSLEMASDSFSARCLRQPLPVFKGKIICILGINPWKET